MKNQDLANQRLTEAFKSTSREFREAIHALLGFKIDALKNKTYRLCSLYSDSPQQFLLFKVSISLLVGGGGLVEQTNILKHIYVTH